MRQKSPLYASYSLLEANFLYFDPLKIICYRCIKYKRFDYRVLSVHALIINHFSFIVIYGHRCRNEIYIGSQSTTIFTIFERIAQIHWNIERSYRLYLSLLAAYRRIFI